MRKNFILKQIFILYMAMSLIGLGFGSGAYALFQVKLKIAMLEADVRDMKSRLDYVSKHVVQGDTKSVIGGGHCYPVGGNIVACDYRW